jgi:nicotinamide mononucleotide transporter
LQLFDIHNTFTIVFGYPLSYAEIIATFFGLFSIWLATKQIIWTWLTGLISIIFSFIIFYQVRLYSDMFLQVYFFIANVYGWLIWERQLQQTTRVTRLSKNARALTSILLIIATIAFGIFIKNIHLLFPNVFSHPASFPFIDSLIAVASVIGTILLAKRIIDNWLVWLTVDLICVFVYASKNIMFISLEYAVFCFLACLGLFKWQKSLTTDSHSVG